MKEYLEKLLKDRQESLDQYKRWVDKAEQEIVILEKLLTLINERT